MRLRPMLAGSVLVFALAACSGGSEDTAAEAPAATETSAAAPTPAATDTAAADATPTDAVEASATPTATPSATASAKPTATPTPTPTPTKVAAVAPAGFGRCAVCHDASKGGADKLGPNLWGVYGSKAGQGGFAYSDALKGSGLTWDEATLHKWLENPRALVPGNRMSFPGLKDAAKRQEIIDYLKQQR